MNKLIQQKILDFVAKKLGEQGVRSFGQGHCLYRGPGGTKCAVGHLIPDTLYDPGMERISISRILEGTRFSQLRHMKSYRIFIDTLQIAHDHCHTPYEINVKLRDIAKYYGLQDPAPIERWS